MSVLSHKTRELPLFFAARAVAPCWPLKRIQALPGWLHFLDVEVTPMFYKHMLQSDSADLCGDTGSCSMMVMKRGPSKQEVYPAVFLN